MYISEVLCNVNTTLKGCIQPMYNNMQYYEQQTQQRGDAHNRHETAKKKRGDVPLQYCCCVAQLNH